MLQGERGRALVARMPASRVSTESDGPFAHIDGKAIAPWQVGNATVVLAEIWSVSPHDADKKIIENFKTLLGAEMAL
jgi:TatD DNase family protein